FGFRKRVFSRRPKAESPARPGVANDNGFPSMANFLDEYRRKRAAGRTPEPFGKGEPESLQAAPVAGPRVFCVQQHAARRMHHDLRLEWRGVLKSWAVPQGP